MTSYRHILYVTACRQDNLLHFTKTHSPAACLTVMSSSGSMNGGDCGDHQDRAAALQRDKCKLLRLVNYLCSQGQARGNTKAIDLALGCDTFERHLRGPEPPANVSAQDTNAALESDVVHLVLLIGAMGNISGPWERK